LATHGGLSGKVVGDLSDKRFSRSTARPRASTSSSVCRRRVLRPRRLSQDGPRRLAIQLITGLLFEGPQLIGEINAGLVKLMEKKGFTSVSQIIGQRE